MTVPPNSSVAFPIGTQINLIQKGVTNVFIWVAVTFLFVPD